MNNWGKTNFFKNVTELIFVQQCKMQCMKTMAWLALSVLCTPNQFGKYSEDHSAFLHI